MAETPRFQFPLVASGQAQKHVTVNEALGLLDVLVASSVLRVDLNAPPETVEENDRFWTGDAPSGEWAGHPRAIAVRQNDQWAFVQPPTGLTLLDESSHRGFICVSGDLIPMGEMLGAVGLGASTSPQRPLAIEGAEALLTNSGGDFRLLLNKAAGAIAGLLFQSDYVGHAELQLDAQDQFNLRTSADGQTWRDSLQINPQTGHVAAPQGIVFPGYWRAYANSTLVVTGTPLSKIVLDVAPNNPQSAFNVSTGAFTAPDAGIYMVNINFNTENDQNFILDVTVNGQTKTRVQIQPSSYTHLAKTFFLMLNAGDVVELWAQAGGTVRFDGGGDFDDLHILRLGVV